MSYSIVIVPFVALVAKLGFGEESFRGLAPVVMAIFFDQRDSLSEGVLAKKMMQ